MASKFQVETVMELGKVNEETALEIVEVLANEALVESWSNGTNRQFKIAINYAKMFIANGNSWE